MSDALAPDQTSKTELELPSNNSIKKNVSDVNPQDLPLPNQESLREAVTASASNGRTLRDDERRNQCQFLDHPARICYTVIRDYGKRRWANADGKGAGGAL